MISAGLMRHFSWYEQALAIHRQVGDRRNEGAALANLALLHQEQGRIEEAQAHFEAALVITNINCPDSS